MVAPRVVPRAEHAISRRGIDADALKVLHRLRQFEHTAYLVGGSVRDLLIGRHPKDFDIGTSAHPYQVKKLFRNCWIIGRRFRLAHVRFGPKVIEVATFRRQLAPGEEVVQDGVPAPVTHPTPEPVDEVALDDQSAMPGPAARAERDHYLHRDNTFGTPEEDAFRRDFTINALFYDIATFSVIDYVGGLEDLRGGLVRAIGDPEVRFREDPVRMIRAVALAARLDFRIDEASLDAIRAHRHEIARSSPPRLLEEYYKILRAGASARAFRDLAALGLLEPISMELHQGAESVMASLGELDAYRRRFESTPDTLTNAILLGSLIAPLGLLRDRPRDEGYSADRSRLAPRPTPVSRVPHADSGSPAADAQPDEAASGNGDRRARSGPRLGELPLARRDIDNLRHILGLQRRLADLGANPRAKRSLALRHIFRDALTWMEIHGGAPDIVEHWKALAADAGPAPEGAAEGASGEPRPFRRRRRGRRRRYHPTGH